MRYVLMTPQDRLLFKDEDVTLVDGVAKIYNRKTKVTTEFTADRCPNHFERFEVFFNKKMYDMAYEVALGVEVTDEWGMKFW